FLQGGPERRQHGWIAWHTSLLCKSGAAYHSTRQFLLAPRRGLRTAPPPATVCYRSCGAFSNVADVVANRSRVCSHRRNVSDPVLRGAARPNTSKNQNVLYYGRLYKASARTITHKPV